MTVHRSSQTHGSDAAAWTTKVNALRKAGGGALTLDVIMHGDRRDLARLAASGGQRSKWRRLTVLEMDETIAVRSHWAPILCSTCPKQIHGGDRVVGQITAAALEYGVS